MSYGEGLDPQCFQKSSKRADHVELRYVLQMPKKGSGMEPDMASPSN